MELARKQRALKRRKSQTVPQGFHLVKCANCAKPITVQGEVPKQCECGSSRALWLGKPVVIYWK